MRVVTQARLNQPQRRVFQYHARGKVLKVICTMVDQAQVWLARLEMRVYPMLVSWSKTSSFAETLGYESQSYDQHLQTLCFNNGVGITSGNHRAIATCQQDLSIKLSAQLAHNLKTNALVCTCHLQIITSGGRANKKVQRCISTLFYLPKLLWLQTPFKLTCKGVA